MTENLKKSIESLRSISPSLNAATDEATRVVAMVEKFLNEECSIGLPAETCVDSINLTSKASRITWLEYRRVDGKFCVAVVTGVQTEFSDDYGHPDSAWKEEEVVRWASAPRDLKLKSFEKLPKLLERIAAAAGEAASKTAAAADTVGKLLAAFDKK